MRRKVIQIAESTLLVSLPKKWADKQNIKKGDEINVQPGPRSLTLTVDSKPQIERAEITLNQFGVMAHRVILALYKKGIDEITVNFEKPVDFEIVQKSLQNKTVGFEVVEQGGRSCMIKMVSGHTEEFDPILRRLFLLLMAMSSEGYVAIKNKDLDSLRNLRHLEETNNRLTQICRRYLNKIGKIKYSKIGPMYFIVEGLEKLADEYKYLFDYLEQEGKNKIGLSKEFFGIYTEVDKMIKLFYENFYKFDAQKLAEIGRARKDLVQRCVHLMERSDDKTEIVGAHYLLVIMEKIFDMTGPHMIIAPGLHTEPM